LPVKAAVVFAPTYRTDMSTEESREQAGLDLECAYRFARSIAEAHGGDLDRPAAFVGWSLGATAALVLGLTDDVDPSGDLPCYSQVPRPDVIVAISGCHYEWEGPSTDDVPSLGNKDAAVVLVAGEDDTNCPAAERGPRGRVARIRLRPRCRDARGSEPPRAGLPRPRRRRVGRRPG
jgi:hypothetical protein